jgi:type VI secretion system protein ImpK
MTMDPQGQSGDLQKTVMIPVLSLQPSELSQPPPNAGFAMSPTSAGTGAGTGTRKSDTAGAADIVCEQILQATASQATHTNPILAAAMALVMMAGQLRSAAAPKNSTRFSQLLINSVREFDRNLLHTQLRHETALVARYILCSAIDESVLSTGWGISCGWAHRSLLRLFHSEANGGDRFFALLEHAMARQQECRDLLELFYLCLSLGFEGRLHLDPRGHDKIETLRMQLYRMLYREQPRNTELAMQWRPVATAGAMQRQPRYLRALFITAAITACSFCGLRLWLGINADKAASACQQAFLINRGYGS